MQIAIDTSILSLLLRPGSVSAPADPRTGKPIEQLSERLAALEEALRDRSMRVLIPATVWAEFLVIADKSAQDYLDVVRERANVRIVPFDEISAVEAALDQRRTLGQQIPVSRQCLKADRQIVAIAKTKNVDMLYAGDSDFRPIATRMGVPVTFLWELPVPPSKTPLLDEADRDATTPDEGKVGDS